MVEPPKIKCHFLCGPFYYFAVEPKKEISVHRYLLWLLLAVMLGGCAAYTATSGQVVLKDDSKAANIRLSPSDRRVIEEYYRTHAGQKGTTTKVQAVIGRALPAGAKTEPLPRELEQKLSPLSSSHVRLRVGQDVMLVDSKTRIVVDMFHGMPN
jgi:hypothetical protein